MPEISKEFLYVKPVGDIPTKPTPDSNDEFLIYDGTDLKKSTWSNVTDYLASGVNGEAIPTTDPPETGFYRYIVHTAGTYTNFLEGGVPIEVIAEDLDGNIVFIEVTDNVAKKVPITIPLPPLTTVLDPLDETDAVTGKAVGDYVEEYVENNALKREEVLTTIETNSTVLKIVQLGSSYDSSTFSGFGFEYGVVKNFNRVTLPIWQRADSTDPFSRVYLRIREDTYQGAMLFDGFKDVSIPEGTNQDVTFDFPLIENLTDKNIWVEFVCDGLTRLNLSTSPTRPWRYKTTGFGVTDFNTFSSPGATNAAPFPIEFINSVSEDFIIPSLIADKVELGNEKPVSSDAVHKAYSDVIVDGFSIEDSTIIGAPNLGSSSSTFKGWGQLIPDLANFNRLGYIFNAFDAALIPTKVRCVVRIGAYDGVKVFDQTKNVSLQHNVPQKVYFDLPEIYENTANDELFVSFFADGMISAINGSSQTPNDEAHTIRWTTSVLADLAPYPSTSVNARIYIEVLLGSVARQISESEVQRIAEQITARNFDDPDVLLTSRVWLYPTSQYNIFDKNVVVPQFGDNLSNYRTDYAGAIGQQFNRGYRLNSVSGGVNNTITLNLLHGRNVLTTKTQNLLSTTTSNGSGINRKVLIIGDSTIDGGDINIPLKSVFDTDVMDITFVGTRGTLGLKHEGRAGWTFNDYYGIGRKLYQVNVVGIATPPTTGAVYKQILGNNFTVVEVNITEGTGYFKLSMANGSADLSTDGTLTKQSGTGENVINYTGSTADSQNPFYSASTLKFDLPTYLTNTSQTLDSNDWIFFQLGINDMFGATTIAEAEGRVNTILEQLGEMLENISAYNPAIRVGIVVTIPSADQDAFGSNYALGQTSEMYQKTGLLTLQKAMIETYDNNAQRALNRFLVSAHLNIDTEYNFPSAEIAVNSRNPVTIKMQTNGVHPDANGYAQMADLYAGIIKYFA